MALFVLDANTGEFVKLSTTAPDGQGEVKLNIGGITISGGLTVDNVTVTNLPNVQDIQGNVIVSGTVATTLTGNPTVTITNLPSISGTVVISNPVSGVHVANFPSNQNVTVTNPVSGVQVANFPATQNVNITNSFVSLSGTTSIISSSLDPVYTRGKMRQFKINPGTTVTGYAQYAAISGLVGLTNAIAGSGRGTFLHSVQFNGVRDTSFARLIFFDQFPSTSTFINLSGISVAFADQEKMAAYVDSATAGQIDTNTYSAYQDNTVTPLPKAMYPVSGTTLWMAVQAKSATTFTGDDLDITLIFYDE